MKNFGVLLSLLMHVSTAVWGDLNPESQPRPKVDGYQAISGVCNPLFGTLPDENYDGVDGTFKACAMRCSELPTCQGFNFVTDYNKCSLFATECDQTAATGVVVNVNGAPTTPRQNFYLRGDVTCSASTVDTEFFVAFMANRVTTPNHQPLEVWVAQEANTKGSTVYVQLDNSIERSSVPTKVQVPFQQTVKTSIPANFRIQDSDQGVNIERKAIRFYSNDPFTLYGVNKESHSTDAFMGIPTRLLGSKYIAVCHWPPFYNCEIIIAATMEGTTVKITLPKAGAKNLPNLEKPGIVGVAKCALPYNGKTYTNGDSFTLNLDQFQVAQIQDLCDLSGALIEADSPIAVWSGDSRANVGDSSSRDHLVDQLFSVDRWGTNCAAWPTPNRQAALVDTWLITAAYDNTQVRVDSTAVATATYTINAGESVRFSAASVSDWMYFSSTKPFQAVQFSHSAVDQTVHGDPSMTVCVPTTNFGYSYDFVTPNGVASAYENYMTIITPDGTQSGFQLDGNALGDIQWTNIPHSQLVGGYVTLDSSKQAFRIENTLNGVAFEAYIYGAGDRESYAYPCGTCMKTVKTCSRSLMVVADGKDNDCDGVIDEELLDGFDNDLDGLIDEDCYLSKSATTAKAAATTPAVKKTTAKALTTPTKLMTKLTTPGRRRATTTTNEPEPTSTQPPFVVKPCGAVVQQEENWRPWSPCDE